MQEALNKEAMISDKEVMPTHSPVRVVSKPEEGLDDSVVQMILNKGYGIVGYHRYPRIAVEYTKATEGFTRIPAGCPNHSYEVVMRNGILQG